MKRFNIDRPEQFELVYECLINRAQGYNLPQSRMVGKILSQFEANGKVKEVKNGIDLYAAAKLPLNFELEDAQFALVQEVFNETVWTGLGARRAVAVADWLDEVAKSG